MTIKEQNNQKTEQAWKHLYKRFEQDGLLPDNTPSRRKILHSPVFRYAACITLICICIISIRIINQKEPSSSGMLVLQNEKNAPTLASMLEDGSIVYLSEHTSLQYPEHFQANKREVILQGDAFFDISKNPEKPFFIETESVRVEVLGTAFSIKSKDYSPFSLSVRSGEVKVTLKKNNQTVHVRAGETTLLASGQLQITQNTPDSFDAYVKRIHFKDGKLADVIRIINMNSDSVRLKITPNLENRLLTVSFSDNEPDKMAELICLALNLECVQQQNIIFISDPDK